MQTDKTRNTVINMVLAWGRNLSNPICTDVHNFIRQTLAQDINNSFFFIVISLTILLFHVHLFSTMFCLAGIPLVIVGISLGATGKAGYGNED